MIATSARASMDSWIPLHFPTSPVTSHDLDRVHLFQHGGGSLATVKNWEVRSAGKSTHDAIAMARNCSVVLLFFLVHGVSEVRPQIKVLYGLEFNLSVISDIAVHALNRKFHRMRESTRRRLFLAGAFPMLVLTREYFRPRQEQGAHQIGRLSYFPTVLEVNSLHITMV